MESEGVGIPSYVLKRTIQLVPVVFVVIVLTFSIIHLAPGDPAVLLAGPEATPDIIQEIEERLGLDKPFHEQLLIYLGKIIRGDLGYSYHFRVPVASLIAEKIPATVLLMSIGWVLASVIGVILGVISSKKPNSFSDNFIGVTSLVGYSLPIYFSGMLIILLFGFYLDWFPVQGMTSLRVEYTGIYYVFDVLYHVTLPALTLGVYNIALIVRLTRAKMLDVLREDFILTARSKGLSENTVFYRHALKNALLPVTTVMGMKFGYMLAGATLVETVFAWPGLGRLMYDAILGRDYPILMGMFIIISIMVVLVNLITDILYAYLDPRIRYR